MRVVIIGLIFTAVILAGGTAYMLRSYLSSQEAEFASKIPKAPTSSVMVAAVDMPTGTPLNAKNIEWQPWPEDAIQDGFLVKTRDNDPLTKITKDKHVSRRAFTKGEPIVMSKLYKSDDPGFLRGSLSPGMRAVAVKSNAETSASGFILPGDHVDIMLTHSMVRRAMERQASNDGTDIVALEHTSETIMENLRVLAVDQKVSEFEGGAVVAKNVLLEVTPKQAEKLNTAKSMGKLSLILRSAEEGTPRNGPLYTTDVEVSPILSAIGGISYESGGEMSPLDDPERSDDDDIYTPPKRVSKKAAPPPQQTGFTSSAPQKRQITIYRGPGAAGDSGFADTGDETSADGELVE